MMKRNRLLAAALSLIAVLALLFSLASCGKDGDYPEIKSSKKEATTVATLGGHEVKYELFRAYFSAMYSGRTDGMTEEGWNAAVEDVMREIALIYATFDVAEENGVDPYGDAIDKAVAECIRIEYEGGEDNGVIIEGVGTREKYKEALAEANLTDAVNRLIYRYDATQSALDEYLVENYAYGKDPGEIGDPLEFFHSDDCAHGVWVYVSDEMRLGREAGLAYAEELRGMLSDATDYAAVKKVVLRGDPTSLSSDDIQYGFYVSKNQGNTPVQRALVSDFFSLAPYACGEIREDADGVWFVVGLPKNAADYDRDPEAIFQLMYAEEKINRPITEKAATYLAGVSYSSAFPSFSAETLSELTIR